MAEDDARTARLETIQNRVFGPGDEVVIDGHAYVNCFFGACTIIYSGGDFGLSNTTTDGTFTLDLRDAAARTGTFLNWFKIDPRSLGTDIPYDPIH